VTKNIIVYSESQKPKNDYPQRIVSPPVASKCCTEQNRFAVGQPKEVEGFKFQYKICKKCGHAVKYYVPSVESTSKAVQEYRSMKRYMVQ
jgi:hypothetical protein